MPYIPDWQTLSDVLKQVMACGVTEDEAKTDLCRAIADRKIDVRVRIGASDHGMRGQVFSKDNVDVPAHLGPDDLDWVQSHPLKPWPIGPVGPQNYTWLGGWSTRAIDLIELSTADTQSIFGSSAKSKPVAKASDETSAMYVLRDLLLRSEHLTRKQAFDQCHAKFPRLSQRGFQQRVWPEGRKLANLPPIAQAGAKPKWRRSSVD